MDSPPTLPKKKDVLEALLSDSNVFLHLDPRRDGVVVPRWFQNQPELTLQVGLNMPVPIRDLEIDDNGVSCTLSFSRTPFWCSLPWSAIFAIVSEPDRRGGIWPEDVPPDGQWGKSFRSSAPPPSKRPKLTALGPNDRPPEEDAPVSGDAQAAAVTPPDKCGSCGTKWIEDQSSCPVCGASVEEAAKAGADAPKVEPSTTAPGKAPGKPVLAAAPQPAPDRPVLVRKKGGRPSQPGADDKRRLSDKKTEKPKAVPRPKPVLAPAPAVEPPAARAIADAVASVPDRVESGDVPRSAGAAPPSAPPSTGTAKKTTKRELPPYLRVVK